MGDCASREMTVTSIERLAYRTRLTGRWHLSLQDSIMKMKTVLVALISVSATACVTTPPVTVPAPVNTPGKNPTQPTPVEPSVNPAQQKPATRGGAWSFAYTPGTYTYVITTDAAIAPATDTTQRRQAPETSQKTSITVASNGEVQVVDPLAVTSGSCDSNAALTTRAQQLIPKLPNHLSAGDHWRDSTTTNGCRGMIPAESTVISNYAAVGDTTFTNVTALQIQRTDTLFASGEGADGQHRILVTAKGTGVTSLFFDVAGGRFVGSRGLQNSLVNVTTSGRSTQFIQRVTESVAIVGSP